MLSILLTIALRLILLLFTGAVLRTDIARVGIDICDTFEAYWTVFRKNISTAKRSVIPSYLTMLDRKNFKEGVRITRTMAKIMKLSFNGSKIGFVEDETKEEWTEDQRCINASAKPY